MSLGALQKSVIAYYNYKNLCWPHPCEKAHLNKNGHHIPKTQKKNLMKWKENSDNYDHYSLLTPICKLKWPDVPTLLENVGVDTLN